MGIFAATPALLLYFVAIAAVEILSCAVERTKKPLTVVNIVLHILAVFSFVESGATLEELLILFLFSIFVSLAAGDFFRKKHLRESQPVKETGEEVKIEQKERVVK